MATGIYTDRDGYVWESCPSMMCDSCEALEGVIWCEDLEKCICRKCFYQYVFSKPKQVTSQKLIGVKMAEVREQKQQRSIEYMRNNARRVMHS